MTDRERLKEINRILHTMSINSPEKLKEFKKLLKEKNILLAKL
jgi:hypothetical protein